MLIMKRNFLSFLLSISLLGSFIGAQEGANNQPLETTIQKRSLQLVTSKSGIFADESVSASVEFALSVADGAFPGWREYDSLDTFLESRSVNKEENSNIRRESQSIAARGMDENEAAFWGLSINYNTESIVNGWTVEINISKGAYTGRIVLTFAPFAARGKFALVKYVREFSPNKLIIVSPEPEEAEALDSHEEAQTEEPVLAKDEQE